MTETNRIYVGTGWLDWEKGERIIDRYGTVNLYTVLDSDNPMSFASNTELLNARGMYGILIAVVVEIAQPYHIGDLFHGIYPTTPSIGDEIVLGTGTLIVTEHRYTATQLASIGLKPLRLADKAKTRDSWWLDPHQLYKVHGQCVKLYFEPCAQGDYPKHEEYHHLFE